MRNRNESEDWDDGKTVADMSGLSRPGLFGQGIKRGKKDEPAQTDEPPLELTHGEKFAFIMGALKAALLIAFVFIAVLGLAIFIMTRIWR